MKEEEPSGTYVFTVKAVDNDPPEAGGTITYTFVSAPGERLKFSIDPETGVIKTRHVSAYDLSLGKCICKRNEYCKVHVDITYYFL